MQRAWKRRWKLRMSWIAGVLVAIALAAHFYVGCVQRVRGGGPHSSTFSGTVVDKTIRPRESIRGSRMQHQLVLDSEDEGTLVVYVPRDVYERVETGMWLERSPDAGYLLLERQPRASTP